MENTSSNLDFDKFVNVSLNYGYFRRIFSNKLPLDEFYLNFEQNIIDCTDSVCEVLKHYSFHDNRVEWLHQGFTPNFSILL